MTARPATSVVGSTPLWVYALLAFVATAGFFYINIMAAIVDGLVTDWGFSNAQAGGVAAACATFACSAANG